jgi:hypothetical protein
MGVASLTHPTRAGVWFKRELGPGDERYDDVPTDDTPKRAVVRLGWGRTSPAPSHIQDERGQRCGADVRCCEAWAVLAWWADAQPTPADAHAVRRPETLQRREGLPAMAEVEDLRRMALALPGAREDRFRG